MDLIKKLGGYEKAKIKYADRPFCLAWSDIGAALLNYRREHNIFEAGDKVVHLFYKGSDVQEVKGVNGLKLTLYHHNMGYHYIAYAPDFKHATDAEIAAGHRL